METFLFLFLQVGICHEAMASLYGCSCQVGDVAVKLGAYLPGMRCGPSGRASILSFRSILASLLRCVPLPSLSVTQPHGQVPLVLPNFCAANHLSRICWYPISNTLRTVPKVDTVKLWAPLFSPSLVSLIVESGDTLMVVSGL